MKTYFRMISLVYPIRKLIITGVRRERTPIQSKIPGLMPLQRPWYLALLIECLKTILLLIAGFALAIIFMGIGHYTGIEYLFNPMLTHP